MMFWTIRGNLILFYRNYWGSVRLNAMGLVEIVRLVLFARIT